MKTYKSFKSIDNFALNKTKFIIEMLFIFFYFQKAN